MGIAHEIKNPLNFVNNYAQISAELADELKAEFARLQDTITEEEWKVKKRNIVNLSLPQAKQVRTSL